MQWNAEIQDEDDSLQILKFFFQRRRSRNVGFSHENGMASRQGGGGGFSKRADKNCFASVASIRARLSLANGDKNVR